MATKKKGRPGARRGGYDESKPWGEIAQKRREGFTFKELQEKYKIPRSTLSRVLNDKIGAFPGDEVASPLEIQAMMDDKRTPAEIAHSAMLQALRKIERQIKSRRPTPPRDVEILLNIWTRLEAVEEALSMEGEALSRIDELHAERIKYTETLDEMYAADEKLRAAMGAEDKEAMDGDPEPDPEESP